MSGVAPIFREIHRLRKHVRNLEDEIARQPRVLKGLMARVAGQENLQKEAQDALKKLKVATLDLESQLKSANQRIEKYTKQKNDINSKKEFDALEHEIDADRKKCKDLEDTILENMVKAEEDAAKLPELERAIQKAKAECANFEKSSQARLLEIQAMLAEARNSLKEVEATLQLPPEVVSTYNRNLAVKKEDAFSSVEAKTCTACSTAVTLQGYNDLLTGRYLVCMSCSRVLYLAS